MNTLPGATVRVTFNDGTDDIIATYGDTFYWIANRYQTTEESLVVEIGEDRCLVWLDEASAENDDGRKAVAEIREA